MPTNKSQPQTTSNNNSSQIRELRAEIAQLKLLLAEPRQQGKDKNQEYDQQAPRNDSQTETLISTLQNTEPRTTSQVPGILDKEHAAPDNSSKLLPYYRQHTLFRFFEEVRYCVRFSRI